MSELSKSQEVKREQVQAIVDRLGGDLASEGLYRSVHDNMELVDVIELFSSGSVGFYKIAQDIVRKRIDESELQESLAAHIEAQRDGALPLLRVLATLDLPESAPLKEALCAVAFKGDSIFAEAATKVLALRYKETIPGLIKDGNAGIRQGLNYAQDPTLIEPLLGLWGVTDDPDCTVRPPIGLGLLVTQYALADLWERSPHLAYSVARAYGYIDDAAEMPDQELVVQFCELLRAGFMSVDNCLLHQDIDSLRSIESQFLRTLMPWSTGMTGAIPDGFDPVNPLWQILFLSAVRESEATNFDIKRDELPFTQNGQENIRWAEFSYTPLSYGRRELLLKPMGKFKEQGIFGDLLPQYLLEHAVCRLERDARAQEEQMLFFESRWALAAQTGEPPADVTTFPLREFDDARDVAELVVPRKTRPPLQFTDTVTLAGNSVQKLLRYSGRAELAPLVSKIDNHARSILPTIGIEIQCPFSNERRVESVAWKQALRSFGIPSPRRPEYRQMVEASYPPGYSFQIHVAAVMLLRELGLYKEGNDMALHVSLSGELGEDAKYILFAQQLIQRPSKSPPGAWLMSKGFAHLHEDAVDAVSGNGKKEKRTELRSMRILDGDIAHADIPECLDDIACMHLLGGALASSVPVLHDIWSDFRQAVDLAVSEMPEVMQNWLAGDWYERVGDSFDRRLMHTLPIMKLRKEALLWMNEGENRAGLREQFLELRNSHARKVFEAMPGAAVYEEASEFFVKSQAGIPLFMPTLLEVFDV